LNREMEELSQWREERREGNGSIEMEVGMGF
jgi:hypothetical protein